MRGVRVGVGRSGGAVAREHDRPAGGHPPRDATAYVRTVPTLFMPSVTVWTFRLTYCTPSALVNSNPCRSPRHHEVQYDS